MAYPPRWPFRPDARRACCPAGSGHDELEFTGSALLLPGYCSVCGAQIPAPMTRAEYIAESEAAALLQGWKYVGEEVYVYEENGIASSAPDRLPKDRPAASD